jgi:hypothetical protein
MLRPPNLLLFSRNSKVREQTLIVLKLGADESHDGWLPDRGLIEGIRPYALYQLCTVERNLQISCYTVCLC